MVVDFVLSLTTHHNGKEFTPGARCSLKDFIMTEEREERPAGILTDTQRAFLKSDGEYYTGENASQQRYQRRMAIQEGLRNAILDFKILYEDLDDAEIRELYDLDPEEFMDLYHGLVYGLRFLYRLIEDAPEYHHELHFPEMLAQAVTSHELLQNDRSVNPQFYLNPTPREVVSEQAAEKFREGKLETMTVAEMRGFLSTYRESLDPERPSLYAQWRYGTSREPAKAGEMSFSEWLEETQRDDGGE